VQVWVVMILDVRPVVAVVFVFVFVVVDSAVGILMVGESPIDGTCNLNHHNHHLH
jgi:hypothetical protein